MRNDDLRGLKEKRSTPEGQVDKNGKPLKFSRPPACRAYAPEGIWNLIGASPVE